MSNIENLSQFGDCFLRKEKKKIPYNFIPPKTSGKKPKSILSTVESKTQKNHHFQNKH